MDGSAFVQSTYDILMNRIKIVFIFFTTLLLANVESSFIEQKYCDKTCDLQLLVVPNSYKVRSYWFESWITSSTGMFYSNKAVKVFRILCVCPLWDVSYGTGTSFYGTSVGTEPEWFLASVLAFHALLHLPSFICSILFALCIIT